MLTPDLKTQIQQSFNAAKNTMPGFKIRKTQNKMIAEISKTLAREYPNSKPILCVEAPTGTGKTMAYLLSAIPIAKASQHKLVVSSANVALQEQLLNKDMPEIQKYCMIDFEYVLVKGRSRYLCVRNLINLLEDNTKKNPLFETLSLWDSPPGEYQIKQLNKLLEDYSDKKWSGEIDDLTQPPDGTLWKKIACNRFTCSAKNCDFYNDCAFFKARRQITKADVIIANHDLILADLNTGNTVLPTTENCVYIFDEAHHLNQKALSHFSLNTSTESIKTSVRQVQNIGEKTSKIMHSSSPKNNIKQIDNYLAELILLFKNLDFNEAVYLFPIGVVDVSIQSICQNLYTTMKVINTEFEKHKETWQNYLKITSIQKTTKDLLDNAIGECEQHLSAILSLFSSFLQIDESGQTPHSRWIEETSLPNKKTNYILNSAQIDIGANLNHLIWSKVAGAVLTSATLSSLGSFERLNQQLGLTKAENQYLRLPSPFAFEQVDFIIANFKNNPTQIYEHTQEVAVQLLKRIDKNAGSLALFASNKQMQMVADLIEKKLKCTLFVQGEFSKKSIIKKHLSLRKQNKGSVIFGLDSFAEGVDLKGNNLTHVIIIKLRFSVPTSPIEKTTNDYLKSQNRNPFMEVSLADASLRLIQACGRLIRSETDSGKITIFDNRLVSKFYGKQLIDALPGYNIVIE